MISIRLVVSMTMSDKRHSHLQLCGSLTELICTLQFSQLYWFSRLPLALRNSILYFTLRARKTYGEEFKRSLTRHKELLSHKKRLKRNECRHCRCPTIDSEDTSRLSSLQYPYYRFMLVAYGSRHEFTDYGVLSRGPSLDQNLGERTTFLAAAPCSHEH